MLEIQKCNFPLYSKEKNDRKMNYNEKLQPLVLVYALSEAIIILLKSNQSFCLQYTSAWYVNVFEVTRASFRTEIIASRGCVWHTIYRFGNLILTHLIAYQKWTLFKQSRKNYNDATSLRSHHISIRQSLYSRWWSLFSVICDKISRNCSRKICEVDI